jgi:hypothetical protein
MTGSKISIQRTVFLHCAGGYRSMIAVRYYRPVVSEISKKLKVDLMLLQNRMPKTDFVCQSKILSKKNMAQLPVKYLFFSNLYRNHSNYFNSRVLIFKIL